MNLNGGVAEVYRMLPVVMAGRWAAQARLDYASAKVDAMQKIEQGMAALAGLCV